MHLGRFARNMAQQIKTPKETRTISEPPKKITRTFDEIADLAENQRPEIRQKNVPVDAGIQKQRVNSAGAEIRKFRGQVIR